MSNELRAIASVKIQVQIKHQKASQLVLVRDVTQQLQSDHAVCGEEKCVETCVETTDQSAVYTPPTDQQSTNLPGGQLNSRAGIVKEKKMRTWQVVLQSKAGADGADPCV